MDQIPLNDLISELQQTCETRSLWLRAAGFFCDLGFKRISYHAPGAEGSYRVLGGDPVIHTHGFPQDWIEEYQRKRLFTVDPITRLAARSVRPFFWSEARDTAGLTHANLAFLDRLAREDLGDGLAIPLFGPLLHDGCMGLGFDSGFERPTQSLIDQLHVAAQVFHMAYCRSAEINARPPPALSAREAQVLAALSQSRSKALIAQDLGISHHTVDTLTRRVFRKLGAKDRTTAVLRGLRAGLIPL